MTTTTVIVPPKSPYDQAMAALVSLLDEANAEEIRYKAAAEIVRAYRPA